MPIDTPSDAFKISREHTRGDRRFAEQVKPPKFTDEQQAVADLVDEGFTAKQITKQLSRPAMIVDRLLSEVLLARYRYDHNPRRPFETKPKGGDVMARLAEPFRPTYSEIAKQEGVSESAVARIADKMDSTLVGTKLAVQEVRTSDLLGLVADRAKRVVEAISADDIEKASLAQKCIAIGILIEKRQLLMGEPTQILSIQERGQLNDVIKLVMKEATKRGVVIDVTSGKSQVIPDGNSPFLTQQRPDMREVHARGRERLEEGGYE